MRVSILGLVVGLTVATVAAQPAPDPLPRRGYFGVALEQTSSGARVTGVAPGSTAVAAGIAVGDVIVAIDGQITSTADAVVSSLGRHRAGDTVSIGIQQNGEHRTITAALKAFPSEQMQNATVSYGSVQSEPGVRLRTITSVPLSPVQGRYPAVLLLQGGGCGSIDTPIGPQVGQPALMQTIGSQGFVTMRVEKPGVGDSQGEPCASIGYTEELAGYQAALKALLSHSAVDRDRVYLVGISLGGAFAPVLAAEAHVAGIIVWGTLAAPPLGYPGRSERFFQEFAKVDVPAAWAKVNTRVLVLHGEFDVNNVTTRATHESITAVINRAHPGSAQFKEFAGLDHCWTRHPSYEASKDRCGQGEETRLLQDEILSFLSVR